MRSSIILVFLFTSSLFGQSDSVKEGRKGYSDYTCAILSKLDSLYRIDTIKGQEDWVEFRRIGEGGSISKKFLLYAELVKNTSESELLSILNNVNELNAIRGYAYMAYAYKCDKEKRKEKNLNYSFKLNTINGCVGYTDVSFSEFKKKIRVRNAYDPNPKRTIPDPIEQKVIQEENKIREEQGVPLRKEY